MRRALFAACWVWLAGAVAAQSAPAPTSYGAWLHGLLDGDMTTATRTYERIMGDPDVGGEQRIRATAQRIEIARLQGDVAALDRCLQGLDERRRTAIRRGVLERALPDADAMRAALASGDEARLAELRRSFIASLEREPTFPSSAGRWWSYLWTSAPGDAQSRPRTPAPQPAPDLRLRVPLLPSGAADTLTRRRATRITDLRLLDRGDEADRLEADLVDRLRAIPGRADLAAVGTGGSAPAAADQLDAARARLRRAVDSAALTAAEAGVLRRVLARATELENAEGPEAAVALLRSLPYALLAEQ